MKLKRGRGVFADSRTGIIVKRLPLIVDGFLLLSLVVLHPRSKRDISLKMRYLGVFSK